MTIPSSEHFDVFLTRVYLFMYTQSTHLTHSRLNGRVQATSLHKVFKYFALFFYLWSLLHQLQLNPIWEDTQGPQPLNWRHARKQERMDASRLIGSMKRRGKKKITPLKLKSPTHPHIYAGSRDPCINRPDHQTCKLFSHPVLFTC